jgi:hypothetical protein
MPKDNTKSSPRSKPKAKATTRTRRANVKFAAKDKEKGKHKAGSPSGGSDSGTAHKKPRTKSAQDSAPPRSTSAGSASGQGASGATGATDASGASAATGSAQASGTANPTGMDEDQEEEMIEEILTKEPANRRLRVPWGIQPKEVPKGAKPTQVRLCVYHLKTTQTANSFLEGLPALYMSTVWSTQAKRCPCLSERPAHKLQQALARGRQYSCACEQPC